MPNTLLSGPAGADKSRKARKIRLENGQLIALADFQAIYAALTGDERGEDGRYPLRDERLLPLVEYVRRAIITGARGRGIGIIATNSDGDPARRRQLLDALGPDAIEIVEDPGEDVVKRRLSDRKTGKLSVECNRATNRWYGRIVGGLGRFTGGPRR